VNKQLLATHLLGGVSSVCYGALCYFSRQTVQIDVVLFLVLLAFCWGALLFCYWVWRREEGRFPLRAILFWAVVFRLIGLVGEPILEDDYYRYLWDGRVFATTGNPYGVSPESYFDAENTSLRFQSILDRINHPQLPTIYAPFCEYAFLFSYWFSPGSLLGLKLLLLMADLLTLFLLLKLVSGRNILFYAWCPLLIVEVSFTGHIDAFGILFLTLALFSYRREQFFATAGALGVGVASRIFTLFFMPFLFRRMRLVHWIACVVTLLLFYLPLIEGGGPLPVVGVFLNRWEFNSSLYFLFTFVLSPQSARLVCGVLLLISYAVLFVYARRKISADGWIRGDLVFGLFLLFSPVVNPWYTLWLLPFVVLSPRPWSIVALVVVSLSYYHGLTVSELGLAPYELPSWVRLVEYGSVLVAFGSEMIFPAKQATSRKSGS